MNYPNDLLNLSNIFLLNNSTASACEAADPNKNHRTLLLN